MKQILVDPVQCAGRGLCAAAAPELLRLDEWGYPLLSGGIRAPVREGEERAAKRAVRACPRLALQVREA